MDRKEYLKLYYENNKERLELYRKENKEKIRKTKKIYYEKNKEKRAERNKVYYEENKEIIKEKGRIYRENNREKARGAAKKYRDENKEKLKISYRKRKESWVTYFRGKYGENPQCEVCGKRLKWNYTVNSECVCFDHKNGGEFIKTSPQHWIARAIFNDKNVRIWENCGFGILCRCCNLLLGKPEGRKIRTKNLLEYVFGFVTPT